MRMRMMMRTMGLKGISGVYGLTETLHEKKVIFVLFGCYLNFIEK
jgi:hypothetical protein